MPLTSSHHGKINGPRKACSRGSQRDVSYIFGDSPNWGCKWGSWHHMCSTRFKFLEVLYKDHVQMALDAEGDDMHGDYHRQCALRCYFLFLVDMSMFVDKVVTYVDFFYHKYFNVTIVHEYKWGVACLVYMYSK